MIFFLNKFGLRKGVVMETPTSDQEQAPHFRVPDGDDRHAPAPERSKTPVTRGRTARSTYRERLWSEETRAPIREKRRAAPGWLRDIVGWGVFFVILISFFVIQNTLNGVLTGAVNRITMIMTVVLEIGSIWFWDRYWY